jgi:serine/threonine protein kinase
MTFTTALDEVYQEIEIMKALNHENIIKLYEVIDDPVSDKMYLIMPVADYGEIMQWKAEENIFKTNNKLMYQDYRKVVRVANSDHSFYSEDVIRQFAR